MKNEIEAARLEALCAINALARRVADPAAVKALREIRDLASASEPHKPEQS
jgi:hypothetical protein